MPPLAMTAPQKDTDLSPRTDAIAVTSWQWPARDARFVWRSVELLQLHGLLDLHRRVLIRGPSGIGKRSLVCEYGHRFATQRVGRGMTLRWATSRELFERPPAAWEVGLLAIVDPPSNAREENLAPALSRLLRAAPGRRVIAIGDSPSVRTLATELHFAELPLCGLPVEPGLSLLIAASGRHRVPRDEQVAAADLVLALQGSPARLLELAARAVAQDLPWTECLRRNLL